jgi:pimeloyl-ACP methyl ester carboxylesterase
LTGGAYADQNNSSKREHGEHHAEPRRQERVAVPPKRDSYQLRHDRRFAEAVESGGLEQGIELALEVWAPLGATPEIRRLARENMFPQGAVPKREPLNAVARLDEISTPTLIVTGDRDVAAVSAIADLLERGIPGAERLRFDSDHYLPLREGTAFNERVAEFLARAAGLRARASKPARCRHAP